MIVVGMILAIALVGAYIFLGMKISESIVHGDIKIFFWALHTVTLLTLINVSMSIYFYASLKDKKGPLGPRGVKGKLGDRGKDGDCGGGECKTKTVQILIEKKLEEHYDENDITPLERKTICNLINNEQGGEEDGQTVGGNKEIIKGWNLPELQNFSNSLTEKLNNNNFDNKLPSDEKLKQRIREQETDETVVDNLKALIKVASESLGNSKLNGIMTTECI